MKSHDEFFTEEITGKCEQIEECRFENSQKNQK